MEKDIHSLNSAINKRAGRKLLPSMLVSVLIIAVVFVTIDNYPPLFCGLVVIAANIAVMEIVSALSSKGINIPRWPLFLGSTAMIVATWFGHIYGLAVSMAIVIPNIVVLAMFISPKDFIRRASAIAFTIFYIPFLAGFILLLAHQDKGVEWILTLIVVVACNDTFAYFTGLLLGKHLMIPHVSPKKTWEGFAGALFFTIVGSILVFHYSLHEKIWIGAFVGAIGVITSTCGDLIESAVKRDLEIKDMGSLLPGHGGVLDRIDSLLFTGPAIWFACEFLQHFHW
jgi:phosphatidate cytidylyltransferase